jgi:hypothetical protein
MWRPHPNFENCQGIFTSSHFFPASKNITPIADSNRDIAACIILELEYENTNSWKESII